MPALVGKPRKATGTFPRSVERWRSLVGSEIERGKYPFPVELILGLMTIESRGKVGVVNPNSKASGLLQVMPIALKDFNQDTGSNLSMATMRGTSPDDAREQIRVGLHVLGKAWRVAYREIAKRTDEQIPVSDLARIADLWYAAGGVFGRKALTRASRPTFDAIAISSPGKAVAHAQGVWMYASRAGASWDFDDIDRYLGERGKKIKPKKKPFDGLIAGLLLMAIAWKFLIKPSNPKGPKS